MWRLAPPLRPGFLRQQGLRIQTFKTVLLMQSIKARSLGDRLRQAGNALALPPFQPIPVLQAREQRVRHGECCRQ